MQKRRTRPSRPDAGPHRIATKTGRGIPTPDRVPASLAARLIAR